MKDPAFDSGGTIYHVTPPFVLGKEERRLIEALRAHLGWGEATVVLKNGVPVMLKGLREDVKLSDG